MTGTMQFIEESNYLSNIYMGRLLYKNIFGKISEFV
jgi:hypothetical protein